MVHNKIQRFFIKAVPSLLFIIIGGICCYTVIANRFKGDDWKYCIASDGYGYYGYLPCVFILHNFDYSKIVAMEKSIWENNNSYSLRSTFLTVKGRQFDKCYIGEAVLLMPFFLIAYFLSLLFHINMSGGYSILFQESVSAASVCYMLLGLFFIRKLLKEYKVSETIIWTSLLVVLFGTNLYYYVTMQQSFSHQYSFAMIAMFLYFARKSITGRHLKDMVWMTVAVAFIALIRPTNVICVFAVPFLALDYEAFKDFFMRIIRPKVLFALLAIAAGIYSVQVIVWYFETGGLFVWSYVGEGFNFGHPHFFDVLFSYRKGFFVYTPLMLVALLSGMIYLFRRSIFSFLGFTLFFVAVTYMLSSWSCWYFGGSYGLRAYIDFYPVFIIGLALGLNYIRVIWVKLMLILATLLCTYLNLVQTYQYANFILPYDGITKALYWKIFLVTNRNAPGAVPFPDSTKLSFYNGFEYRYNFETNQPLWQRGNNITGVTAHSGKLSGFVNHNSNFSSILEIPVNRLPQDSNSLYVYITAWVKTSDRDANTSIVVSVESKNNKSYSWNGCGIMSYVFTLDQWQEAGAMVELPKFKAPDDHVVIYCYGTKGLTYINDMDIRFGKLK